MQAAQAAQAATTTSGQQGALTTHAAATDTQTQDPGLAASAAGFGEVPDGCWDTCVRTWMPALI